MVDESIDTARTATDIVVKSIQDLYSDFLSQSPLIIGGLMILILTWAFSKVAEAIVRRLLRKRRMRRSLKDLLRQITVVTIWIIGIILAAVVIFPDMTPAKVLAALGLTSVALGFAFKDIVENFLAGFLILWGFPFDPGDFIRVGGVEGQIKEITLRNTLVKKTDGELVIIPNATVFKENVDVLTEEPVRRVTIICGVAYGEDVDESREVIRKAVEKCETLAKDRPLQIFAQEFGESSINFEVTWWTGSRPVEIRQSRDEVVAAVKRGLDEAGIEIPFPYRTLTFKEPLKINSNDQIPAEKRG